MTLTPTGVGIVESHAHSTCPTAPFLPPQHALTHTHTHARAHAQVQICSHPHLTQAHPEVYPSSTHTLGSAPCTPSSLPAGTSPPWHSASSELCSRHHGARPGETGGPSSPSPRLLLPVLGGAIWGWSLGPGEPGKGSWAGLAGPLSLTLHPPGRERL